MLITINGQILATSMWISRWVFVGSNKSLLRPPCRAACARLGPDESSRLGSHVPSEVQSGIPTMDCDDSENPQHIIR